MHYTRKLGVVGVHSDIMVNKIYFGFGLWAWEFSLPWTHLRSTDVKILFHVYTDRFIKYLESMNQNSVYYRSEKQWNKSDNILE